MKSLSQYINESASFTLNAHERNALTEFIGYITGNYEDEQGDYSEIEVDKNDKEQLDSCFDVLSDDHTYPKINKRLIKNEIPVLKKYLTMAWDKDLIDGNWDLIDAKEKIDD